MSTMIQILSIALLVLTNPVAGFHSAFLGRQQQQRIRNDSRLSMKTIAVIGASGLTASECVYQALQNGDNVVGLTRCVSFRSRTLAQFK